MEFFGRHFTQQALLLGFPGDVQEGSRFGADGGTDALVAILVVEIEAHLVDVALPFLRLHVADLLHIVSQGAVEPRFPAQFGGRAGQHLGMVGR